MNASSKKWLAIIGIFLVAAVVAAAIILPRLEPQLRAKMVRVIEDRFDGTAEIQSLQVSMFPRLQVNGKKLVLWYKNRRDIPALPFCHVTLKARKPMIPSYLLYPMNWHEALKKKRMDLGLTQNALGFMLGVNEATIYNWEKGRVNPSRLLWRCIVSFISGIF